MLSRSMWIGIIVKAKNRSDAIGVAGNVALKILSNDPVFDHYDLENDEGLPEGFPRCARLSTEKGREIVEYLFDGMYDDYLRILTDIRVALDKYTDVEILEEEDEWFVKYLMEKIGRDVGWPISLYDQKGIGIKTRRECNEYLENAKSNQYIVLMNMYY